MNKTTKPVLKRENRSRGNTFEAECMKLLAQNGYFVARLAQTAAGQPADLIAVDRKGHSMLIDCKLAQTSRLALSRIEPNQQIALSNFPGVSYLMVGISNKASEKLWDIAYLVPWADVLTLLVSNRSNMNQLFMEKFQKKAWVNEQ